jgi:hypothetical protein
MRIVDILHHRFRSLFLRKRVEQELEEEPRYHVEREIEEDAASGMRPPMPVKRRGCRRSAWNNGRKSGGMLVD